MVDIIRTPFTIVQSNGPVVELTLRREAGSPPDTFHLDATESDKTGTGDGSFINDTFFLCVIHWRHGPIGEYHGTRGNNGRITGFAFDQTNHASQASWFTLQEFH